MMAIEDEDYPNPARELGPLTRMNMERRASTKHAETIARPWDALRVHFEIKLVISGSGSSLREKLGLAQFPSGWQFLDVVGVNHRAHQFMAIFDVEHTAISIGNGAQVRALLNLLK